MNHTFTSGQMIRLWPLYSFSISISILFQPLFLEANYQGWIGYMLSYPLNLIFAYFVVKLAQVNPKGHFVNFGEKIVGRWIHTIFLFLLVYYFTSVAIHGIIVFTNWLGSTHLKETPNFIISTLFISLSVILARYGFKIILYFVDALFIIVFPSTLLIIAFIGPELEYQTVIALFTHFDWKQVLYATYYINHLFGDLMIFLFLLPYFQSVKNPFQSIAISHGILIVIHLICWLACLLLFGPYLGGQLRHPIIELINYISIRDFVENFEFFLWVVTLASLLTQLAVLLYIVSQIIQKYFSVSDRSTRTVPIFLGVLITIVSNILMDFPITVEYYLDNYYFTLFLIKFIPIIYYIVYKLRFRKQSIGTIGK